MNMIDRQRWKRLESTLDVLRRAMALDYLTLGVNADDDEIVVEVMNRRGDELVLSNELDDGLSYAIKLNGKDSFMPGQDDLDDYEDTVPLDLWYFFR